MKNILVTAMTLVVGLFWAVSAEAQMPTWNAEQSEVWAYVEQSWVDDVAENGRWPGDYTHANAVSWGSDLPAPEGIEKWKERTQFGDQNNTTLLYSISHLAIAMAGDAAVVHYTAVINSVNNENEREREVLRIVETVVRDGGGWTYLSTVSMPFDLDGD